MRCLRPPGDSSKLAVDGKHLQMDGQDDPNAPHSLPTTMTALVAVRRQFQAPPTVAAPAFFAVQAAP